MLTFEKFSGINNVLSPERLVKDRNTGAAPLSKALNVDVGVSGELRRRAGFSVVEAGCHKNLHERGDILLATCNGHLTRVGGAVLYPSLGPDRVWYCDLPDGRITFSNGLINGVTDGVTVTEWGVSEPPGVGAVTNLFGDLFPGEYRYAITYVRAVDGLEGPPAYSDAIQVEDGGILITGLPQQAGYTINVYLSTGEGFFLAGDTVSTTFSFSGKNSQLTLPCKTESLSPAPKGTITAFWRGRTLIADNETLWASRPYQFELFDLRRDFKQFKSKITAIMPVHDGLYVGTEEALYYLGGTEFDKLEQLTILRGKVVLGSGVSVPSKYLPDEEQQRGDAGICIADRNIVACLNSGLTIRMSADKYKVDMDSVRATFRVIDNIPQYVVV